MSHPALSAQPQLRFRPLTSRLSLISSGWQEEVPGCVLGGANNAACRAFRLLQDHGPRTESMSRD